MIRRSSSVSFTLDDWIKATRDFTCFACSDEARAESIARSAIERKESRGGHTRDDFPATDAKLGKVNVVTCRSDDGMAVCQEPLPEIPDELKAIIEEKS